MSKWLHTAIIYNVGMTTHNFDKPKQCQNEQVVPGKKSILGMLEKNPLLSGGNMVGPSRVTHTMFSMVLFRSFGLNTYLKSSTPQNIFNLLNKENPLIPIFCRHQLIRKNKGFICSVAGGA